MAIREKRFRAVKNARIVYRVVAASATCKIMGNDWRKRVRTVAPMMSFVSNRIERTMISVTNRIARAISLRRSQESWAGIEVENLENSSDGCRSCNDDEMLWVTWVWAPREIRGAPRRAIIASCGP